MLLRLFKGNSPGIIFLITVTFIAIWMSAFVHPSAVSASQFESDPMPLYGLLVLVAGKNNLAGVAISFLFVATMAFLLVNFNSDFKI